MSSSAFIRAGAFGISFVLLSSGAGAATLSDATWTGLGGDDRWSNPDNWAGGQLPTLDRRVIEDPNFNWWQSWPHSRQVTVTIDTSAQAGEWSINHFGAPAGFPFRDIRIVPGADFRAGYEFIDQELFDGGPRPSYVQTGGAHQVDEFRYISGEFRMEGGTFIANTIMAGPDAGVFSFLGGYTQVARLSVAAPNVPPLFRVGGTADVHVTEQFAYSGSSGPPAMSFSRPIHMDGADFKNETVFDGFSGVDPFIDMHLIFAGGLADVGLLEVASLDRGDADPSAWTDNAAIGTIEIGAGEPAHVRLMNEFASWNPGSDAQYVDTLRISSGSILDLNGLNLYCRVLDNGGGTFLNGQPMIVPEPGGIALLIAAAAATGRRRRRRGNRAGT